MPKVKLGRDPRQEHANSIARIIKHHMTDRDIATQTELAERSGIPRQTLGRRMRRGGWILDELQELDKVLHFSPEDAAVIMGVRK